jgi:uncharacterized protein YjiK
MRVLSVLFLLVSFIHAGVFSANIVPENLNKEKLGIRILDQKELSYLEVGGVKFSEISDLAYDGKTRSLFMVSDEGKLFEFKAVFSDRIT